VTIRGAPAVSRIAWVTRFAPGSSEEMATKSRARAANVTNARSNAS
jgi:hypothetical protein